MAPLDAFQYQPLASPASIRLVTRVPEEQLIDSKPYIHIQLQLGHAVLSSDLTYEALSYTWGPSVETQRILLNGKAFAVRHNLYSYLQRRGNRAETPLWVDAICINQQDIDERNSQVKVMGDIFTQASKVLIWLGHLGVDPGVLEDTSFPTKDLHQGSYDDKPHRHDAAIEAAKSIYGVEYWKRAWVFQEVSLAREVEILCDAGITIPLAWLLSVSDHSPQNVFQHYAFNTIRGSKAGVLLTPREPHESKVKYWRQYASLDYLISRFGQGHCQLVHDRIYALLGLVHAGAKFQVNYHDSLARLLMRALCFSMEVSETAMFTEVFSLGKRLLKLLEVEPKSLKAALLGDLSTTEDANKMLALRLSCVGLVGENPDGAAHGFKLLSKGGVYLSFEDLPITKCSCQACINKTTILAGDQVYRLGDSRALVFYRPRASSTLQELHLVAIGNFEGRLAEIPTTVFHISSCAFEPFAQWRPKISSRLTEHELILELSMRDFLLSMADMRQGPDTGTQYCRWDHEVVTPGGLIWPDEEWDQQ
ncbi:MAG: hypothetical protein L6R39_002777 [Caloplaca ligustica]|nr:MAG: hypothetical protein L6R39_002777 [Caloplaca ligustica]